MMVQLHKYAVIDIGSNSVRLMFVADGKVLYKRLNTTRLGESIAQTPRLKADALERTAQAVADFYATAKADGAENVFAFATAAVRTAQNGADFTRRVQTLCGVFVEVISGDEEAEIGVLGALGNADGAVIDMGGASTELVVKRDGKIAYKKSVNIGVVRLKDRCGRDSLALENAARAAVSEYGKIPPIKEAVAIGGTATTIAALHLGLKEYVSERITGSVVTRSDMESWADKLLRMTVEEIASLPCMPKGRTDVLAGGVKCFAVLMRDLGIEKLIVSDRDNLEGYAVKKGLL